MKTGTDLQTIPYVGPRTSEALESLGYACVEDLVGQDPAEMYRRLAVGEDYLDRCVLYVFRSAVYYAETPDPDPELLDWWKWKGVVHRNEAPAA
ncbi:MAG: helix-hairpin-helix domain-containing protein [Gemmatimonadota bacterium]|nr:helix-hairpin-helix domain-containing protein [Gemmatimonadota bacterium]